MQLCRENAVNADWSVVVYATKLQCATRHVTLAILSRDKVARQNRAINHRCDIGLNMLPINHYLIYFIWLKYA